MIAFFTLIGFFDSGILDGDKTVLEGFSSIMEITSASLVYVTLIIAVSLAVSYENKILHFDMMAGNKISHIIISKVIVTAPVVALFMTLCVGVVSLYGASKGGVGDTKLLLEYLGIYTCINFRVITVALLIMTIFKGAVGALVVFIRVAIIDMVPMVILTMMIEDGKDVGDIPKFISSMQYTYLNGAPLESSFVIVVIVSMVVEILLMYVLSYISHKKKAFY